MMHYKQLLGRTFLLTVSQVVSRLFGLGVTMLLTRQLGPTAYGDLMIAYAYWELFAAFVDAGLTPILIREAERRPEELELLLGNVILLRIALTLIIGGLAIVILPAFGYASDLVWLCKFALLLMLAVPFGVLRIIFLIRKSVKQLAVLDIVGSFLMLGGILMLAFIHRLSVQNIILLRLTGTIVQQVLYWVYGRRQLSGPISFRFVGSLWLKFARQGGLLMVVGLLNNVEMRVGKLMMGRMLGSVDVGAYTVAGNIAMLTGFISSIYFANAYPLLAHYQAHNQEKFHELYCFSYRVMMVIALPVAFFLTLKGAWVLRLYAGRDYEFVAPVLALLAWGQVFQFAGQVLFRVMLASGMETKFLYVSTVKALVHILALLFLLPRFELLGAALAQLVVYVTVFSIYGAHRPTSAYVRAWGESVWWVAGGLLFLLLCAGLINLPPILVWIGAGMCYGAFLVQTFPQPISKLWSSAHSALGCE
jgi:O-antigen/teichoic acid export membrane protein